MIHDVDEVQKKFQKYLKCQDCEFCFPDPENPGGCVCADQYYGKKLTDEDLNKPICDGEDISLGAYIELDKELEEKEKGTWQTH